MAQARKTIDELRNLPISERLELVGDLWDSITADAAADPVPMTPELAEELDHRLEEFEADPDSALPWDEVRERIRRLAGGRGS